jgi:formate dehydrogenase maturation protein FdhE
MKIHEILAEIDLAYPLDIFPDTTQDERDPIIEKYPGFIDRTSAMMGRHLVNVITDKLAEANAEDDDISAMMAYRRCRAMLSKEHCENMKLRILINHMAEAIREWNRAKSEREQWRPVVGQMPPSSLLDNAKKANEMLTKALEDYETITKAQ